MFQASSSGSLSGSLLKVTARFPPQDHCQGLCEGLLHRIPMLLNRCSRSAYPAEARDVTLTVIDVTLICEAHSLTQADRDEHDPNCCYLGHGLLGLELGLGLRGNAIRLLDDCTDRRFCGRPDPCDGYSAPCSIWLSLEDGIPTRDLSMVLLSTAVRAPAVPLAKAALASFNGR